MQRTAVALGRGMKAQGALSRQQMWASGLTQLPQLSPTMITGKVVSWMKKVGDTVNSDDTIAQIETDKAVLDWTWPLDPFIIVDQVAEGSTMPVGANVLSWADEEQDVEEAKQLKLPTAEELEKMVDGKAEEAPKEAPTKEAPKAANQDSNQGKAPSTKSNSAWPRGRPPATPAALTALRNQMTDIGPNDVITEASIEAVFQNAGSGSGGAGVGQDYTDEKVSGMRSVIAQRLTESKNTVPHFYLTVDLQTANMVDFLASLNAANQKRDPNAKKISVNDFLVKACAAALRKVPQCNSQWHGDVIRTFERVDISVAVATPAGLLTPIVFNADLKGIGEISKDIRTLAGLAKDNKLKPEQFQGGTFTISNLGMMGVKQFTAIINTPQACILAVGATQESGVMSVTLSCDHRVVDGAVGAVFLQELKAMVEDPNTMLL